MELRLVRQNFLHDLFISLGQQTASAVKNWSDLGFCFDVIIEETPVPVVPVKVPKQRICDKHIPEMFSQKHGGYILLLVNGIHDVRKLRPAAVAVGVENGVFDRAEVKQSLSACGEVFTCADQFHFSLDRIGAKQGILSTDPKQIEDAACDMLTDAAVCVGKIGGLPLG